MKVCNKCGEIKPLTDYHKSKATKDGYAYMCKECSNTATNKWRKNNPDKAKQHHDKWRKKNLDNQRQYSAKWRKNNPDKVKKYVDKHCAKLRESTKERREMEIKMYGPKLPPMEAYFRYLRDEISD